MWPSCCICVCIHLKRDWKERERESIIMCVREMELETGGVCVEERESKHSPRRGMNFTWLLRVQQCITVRYRYVITANHRENSVYSVI